MSVKTLVRPQRNSADRPIHLDPASIERFWLWFDGSLILSDGRPRVMYHGTAHDIEEPSGQPFWLAYEPKVAQIYADRAAHANHQDENEGPGDEFIDIDEYNPVYDGVIQGGGQNILPVYVRALKPLDLSDLPGSSSVRQVFLALQKRGIIPATESAEDAIDWMDHPDATSVYRILEELDVYRDIQRLGYDAVIITDVDTTGNYHDSIGVFEPSQVKSAIGNSGKFDPASNRIADQDDVVAQPAFRMSAA